MGAHWTIEASLMETQTKPPPEAPTYVHDRSKNKLMMVDRMSSGDPGDGQGYVIGMSGDGKFVLIATTSALVGNDGNGTDDVYRRGPLY